MRDKEVWVSLSLIHYFCSMKWVGIIAALIVIASCFFPWVIIESKGIVVTGVESGGTNYGKPGYMNFLLSGIFLVLSLVSRTWSIRVNLFIAGLNFAWSIRNFILLARCEAGECPERQTALYALLIASFIMLVALIGTPLASAKNKVS
jgi:hypothetical protein